MKEDPLAQAEKFLHEQIPLTRAMGLRVVADATAGFAVEAKVARNSNHLRTAFGGSINAVATLAGYVFLWLELREEIAQVVIASSEIRFLRPVRETIRAVCLPPAESEIEKFKIALRERGKAHMTISVQIDENGARAAEFEAGFVARREKL